MNRIDGFCQRRVWSEINLVIKSDEKAEGEGPSRSSQRGCVELVVDAVDDTGREGCIE